MGLAPFGGGKGGQLLRSCLGLRAGGSMPQGKHLKHLYYPCKHLCFGATSARRLCQAEGR